MSGRHRSVPADPDAGRIASIRTTRLDLVAMPLGFMVAVLAGECGLATDLLGLSEPPRWGRQAARVLQLPMEDAEAPPAHRAWLYRAAVARDARILVGWAGFASPPGAGGTAEVGVGVLPAHRGHGLGTEALRAVSAWGLRQGASAVIARLGATDRASCATLTAAGFAVVGKGRASAGRPRLLYVLRAGDLAQDERVAADGEGVGRCGCW